MSEAEKILEEEIQEDRVRRNRAVIELINEWAQDDSGYDEETMPELKKALNETRRALGAEPMFPDDE